MMFEELEAIEWDVIEFNEVRSKGAAFIVLNNGHVECYLRIEDRRELAGRFLVNKNFSGNIDEDYSINESVSGLVIKLNKEYKLKVVLGYAPTSSNGDLLVEKFYDYVESE